MRISDWSSDVCSSDLPLLAAQRTQAQRWHPADYGQAHTVFNRDARRSAPTHRGGLQDHRTIGKGQLLGDDLDAGARLADISRRISLCHQPARLSGRSEEHTSELQSLMRISYAVFCLKKKKKKTINTRQ